MARSVLLRIVWIWSIVGLATAREVVNCINNQCNDLHAVVQGPQDVAAVMRDYPNSKNVDFHGNLLTQFLAGYVRPVQWQKLNLSYNMLDRDVFQMFQSPQLKYVDITYNLLDRVTVPASVVEFIAERNKLHSITVNSRNLKRLILPKNKFDSLRGFANLQQLQELDLTCNQLRKLNSDELSTMTSLNALHVANNHIHIIEGQSRVPSLQYIDLSNNLLTTIDETITNFPSIKQLFLQNNKIVMWVDKVTVASSLQFINIHNNDWDCKNLNILKSKLNNKMDRTEVVCTPAEFPYADRLIKYRKQEFAALDKGAAQRAGNTSCENFKPNPCYGDDNRVYEVARSSFLSAGDLAKQSVSKLNEELAKEQNSLRYIENDINAIKQQNEQLANENQDLADYISEQYQQAGLSGDSDAITQLNKIFDQYETANANLKNEIRKEERKNQDALDQLNTIGGELDDKNYEKNQLLEDMNTRNTTVEGLKKKVSDLQKQLGAK